MRLDSLFPEIGPSRSPSAAQSAQRDAFNPARIRHYYDEVHKAAWVRRAAGIFTGATIGLALGAAIGLLAAFLPCAIAALGIAGVATGATALPALTTALTSMAVFGGIGAFTGTIVAPDVGVISGALAGGLAMKEQREVELTGQDVESRLAASPQPSLSGTRYFSWKPAAFFATLCGGFGALMGSVPAGMAGYGIINTTLGAILGATLSGPAAIIGFGALFAAFGCTFGLKLARISNRLSNFYTSVLTDDFFSAHSAPGPTPNMLEKPEPAATAAPRTDHHPSSEPYETPPSPAAETLPASYQQRLRSDVVSASFHR